MGGNLASPPNGRMKLPRHTELARQVLAHLEGWGFPTEVQRRLGVLIVVWGVFETNLEVALWALRGEQVEGVRPSTDKTQLSAWIKELGGPWPNLPDEAQAVLETAARTADDLMQYRHSVLHGWMLPSPTMPTFIRNPRWHGEDRKRPSHDAHIDENLLDMAVAAAWTLCQVVIAVPAVCADPAKMTDLVDLKSDVARAASSANELRHLTALMNDDKY